MTVQFKVVLKIKLCSWDSRLESEMSCQCVVCVAVNELLVTMAVDQDKLFFLSVFNEKYSVSAEVYKME